MEKIICKEGEIMEREIKIKEKRKEIIRWLEEEKITYKEWEFIKTYIDEEYRNSTLQSNAL